MPEDRTDNTFDRLIGALHGLPDVTVARPSTIRTLSPLIGAAQTFIVQTYRQKDSGDTIFIECVSGEGSFRLAIPPKVSEAIARQRESLATKTRSKAAKAVAQERKERGEVPAFLRRSKQPDMATDLIIKSQTAKKKTAKKKRT
jgi:hypothetical protein